MLWSHTATLRCLLAAEPRSTGIPVIGITVLFPCLVSFIPLSPSLWNGLFDPVFDIVGLADFRSRDNAFLLTWLLDCFLSPSVCPVSSFILWVGIVRLSSSD